MDTNTTSKVSKEEMKLKRQEQKIKIAEHPESIFWVPFSGRQGYAVKNLVINIDRLVNRKKRFATNEESIRAAKGVLQRVSATAETIWTSVIEVIPQLHSVSYDNSTIDLNNSKAEKRQLAILPYSIGILPRSPEVGYIAMSIKKFEERGRELQQKNLDALNILIKKYTDVYDQLAALENELNKPTPINNETRLS